MNHIRSQNSMALSTDSFSTMSMDDAPASHRCSISSATRSSLSSSKFDSRDALSPNSRQHRSVLSSNAPLRNSKPLKQPQLHDVEQKHTQRHNQTVKTNERRKKGTASLKTMKTRRSAMEKIDEEDEAREVDSGSRGFSPTLPIHLEASSSPSSFSFIRRLSLDEYLQGSTSRRSSSHSHCSRDDSLNDESDISLAGASTGNLFCSVNHDDDDEEEDDDTESRSKLSISSLAIPIQADIRSVSWSQISSLESSSSGIGASRSSHLTLSTAPTSTTNSTSSSGTHSPATLSTLTDVDHGPNGGTISGTTSISLESANQPGTCIRKYHNRKKCDRLWKLFSLILAWTGTVLAILARRSTAFVSLKYPLFIDAIYYPLDQIGLLRLKVCYNTTYIHMELDEGLSNPDFATDDVDRLDTMLGCDILDLTTDIVDETKFQITRIFATLGVYCGTFLTVLLSIATCREAISLRMIGGGFLLLYFFQSFCMLVLDTSLCRDHRCGLDQGSMCCIVASIVWIATCVACAKMDAARTTRIRMEKRAIRRATKAAEKAIAQLADHEKMIREASTISAATATASSMGGLTPSEPDDDDDDDDECGLYDDEGNIVRVLDRSNMKGVGLRKIEDKLYQC
jgi:hypothetical protein